MDDSPPPGLAAEMSMQKISTPEVKSAQSMAPTPGVAAVDVWPHAVDVARRGPQIADGPAIDRPEFWDNAWQHLTEERKQLFTRGQPRGIDQFWQRCYFEDLWALGGQPTGQFQVLSMGAGRGTISMYLAARGADVTMLDLSAAGFAVADRNFRTEGLAVPRMVLADARCTGLESASYDCVYSIGLLEHLSDPRPVLSESWRLLRPGGFAFHVVIPLFRAARRLLGQALLCPWRVPRTLVEYARELWGEDRAEDQLRTPFGCREYRSMLAELGIAPASCQAYNAYHPLYSHPQFDRWITVPVYRWHRRVKQRWSGAPWMRTLPGLNSCVLVLMRKES
jgi:SAM-dependent methyltransferase